MPSCSSGTTRHNGKSQVKNSLLSFQDGNRSKIPDEKVKKPVILRSTYLSQNCFSLRLLSNHTIQNVPWSNVQLLKKFCSYRIQQFTTVLISLPLDPTPIKFHLDHVFTTYLYKVNFNSIIVFMSTSLKWSLSLGFSNQKCPSILCFLVSTTHPINFSLLGFINSNNIRWRVLCGADW
jgi:hypothetical protein